MRPFLHITVPALLVWLTACSLQPPPKNDWLAEAPKYSQDASNDPNSSVLADVGEVHNGHGHAGSHSAHR
jgi:hypothetical protein